MMGEMIAYEGVLTQADLMGSSLPTPVVGSYVTLGTYTIPRGTKIGIGWGGKRGQGDAEGRVYSKIQDTTPTELKGTLRLEVRNAQGRPLGTLFEARTEQLNTSATDRTQQKPLPLQVVAGNAFIPADYKLALLWNGDATTAIVKANCTFILSTTVVEVPTM